MALSTYLANALLNHVLRNTAYTSPTTVYVALFTTMPNLAGTGGVEVTGGSYTRQILVSGAPASGLSASTNALTFAGMPGSSVVGACLMDAASGGNMLQLSPFATPVAVTAGADFSVPIANVVSVLR